MLNCCFWDGVLGVSYKWWSLMGEDGVVLDLFVERGGVTKALSSLFGLTGVVKRSPSNFLFRSRERVGEGEQVLGIWVTVVGIGLSNNLYDCKNGFECKFKVDIVGDAV